MKLSHTRIPLVIALSTALAFTVGCSDRTADDRAGMERAGEPATQAEPAPAPVAAQSGPLRIEITEGVIEPVPIAIAPFIAETPDAAKLAADITGAARNELYDLALKLKKQ